MFLRPSRYHTEVYGEGRKYQLNSKPLVLKAFHGYHDECSKQLNMSDGVTWVPCSSDFGEGLHGKAQCGVEIFDQNKRGPWNGNGISYLARLSSASLRFRCVYHSLPRWFVIFVCLKTLAVDS